MKGSQIDYWAKNGSGQIGLGQKWDQANLGWGKFGSGQIWVLSKLGWANLVRANLGWAKMA